MISATTILNEFVTRITDAGRSLTGTVQTIHIDTETLCDYLVSEKGEATGVAIAHEVLNRYKALDEQGKYAFFLMLLNNFGSDSKQVEAAFKLWKQQSASSGRAIHLATEPKSMELIRRLNRVKGATSQIVEIRNDLLNFLKKDPNLKPLDNDFKHILSSWFNRGFLELESITWSTSAEILERIIKYEAVHEIQGWDDLRRRVIEKDRRLYAYFHPAMPNEPLIFVEVALVEGIPSSIEPILSASREPIDPDKANTATFYSISNCQPGLRGISFGNFMIKKAVMELQREYPSIKTFVTLSPVPGLRSWAESEISKPSGLLNDSQLMYLKNLNATNKLPSNKDENILLREITAKYLVQARTEKDKIIDPVARFHLGNGACLKHIHANANTNQEGLWSAWGMMVNYDYKLKDIEKNHEAFVNKHEVIHSSDVQALLKKGFKNV
ncbi:malonyl-CoA decarboxylase [uncultured Cocleimonas sp.]|uniref:malonyl-CoA decarboxylase n=1 Tax=uncultured Cocleimonas sp. TaxID=1051587 RepID=UPI002606FFAC|nr:malonyl-CoA decarboxylase [uncultured Cocleimonas sp.]